MLERKERSGKTSAAKILLLAAAAAIMAFNQVGISALQSAPVAAVGSPGGTGKVAFEYSPTGDSVQDAISAVFFTGMPVWSDGTISFDDIEGSLSVLANIDRAILTESLPEGLKQRYINIGTQISCEYCCTARAVIFSDGRAACGCSHSYALRGIAKYLLTQYGDSYTDEEILFEMTKWKNLFFPKGMVRKAAALVENGMEITPAALNDRELLQKIGSGDLGSIGQLQGMVGGC